MIYTFCYKNIENDHLSKQNKLIWIELNYIELH